MKRKFMSATLSFFVALSLVSSRTLQLYAEEEQTEENNEEITEEEVVSEGEAVTPEEEAPARRKKQLSRKRSPYPKKNRLSCPIRIQMKLI